MLIIKSITRSFIMLNTMMENENTGFANISILFLRSCSQHEMHSCEHEHELRKGVEILAKLVLLFLIIIFNTMNLLVVLLIMKLVAQINTSNVYCSTNCRGLFRTLYWERMGERMHWERMGETFFIFKSI